ncbi:hypothetical protein [Streptosporangium lutulentum]|uniref:HD domain-containing protein n=1 Tax=Streptosporangium lutulentum TaxID=1461250 RepID=A0ABT9Q8F2_9ACTN|nr:hypothetical protein [Streptosporangium lutulentum]MDP9842359.1 hypothetical protein [Streptosporangium lutulentum]
MSEHPHQIPAEAKGSDQTGAGSSPGRDLPGDDRPQDGAKVSGTSRDRVVTSHPVIEAVLARYAEVIGADLGAYRNHVYRGLTYQQRLLGRDEVTNDLALAWAVHDLGIWTAGTFDYIAPSADLARKHAAEAGVENLPLVIEMVELHHKIRSVENPLVETFRRADRTDAFRGNLRGRLSRADVAEVTEVLPYRGFHRFLFRQTARNFVRHPLRPLPMFHW